MTFLNCPAGRDSPRRGHDVRDVPAAAERGARRPNNAPAYYLGRPAAVWISAMRPRLVADPAKLRHLALRG